MGEWCFRGLGIVAAEPGQHREWMMWDPRLNLRVNHGHVTGFSCSRRHVSHWSHTVLYCSPDGPCKQNMFYEMLLRSYWVVLFPLVRTVIEVSQSRNGWYG